MSSSHAMPPETWPRNQHANMESGGKVASPAKGGVSDVAVCGAFGGFGAHTQALTFLKPSCKLAVSVNVAAVRSGMRQRYTFNSAPNCGAISTSMLRQQSWSGC